MLSAALLPFVAAQAFGTQGGSSLHQLCGQVCVALTLAAVPWATWLLAEDRYCWWLTTWVELVVLTQWVYHLHGLVATAAVAVPRQD